MKTQDIFFTGMNIPNEAQRLLDTVTVTDGMTDSELTAYNMGVKNTLSAITALLEQDEHLVIHVDGFDGIVELDLADLMDLIGVKENND